MRVYLTGFMGSGKTTVGRHLATALGWPFLDLDRLVEEDAGMSVRELFDLEGEAAFRHREREALAASLEEDPVVVATGGGTFVQAANLELVRRQGVIVWLNPSFATIVARIGRLGKEDRPLFRDEVQAFSLYRRRLAVYREADHRIDVRSDEEPAEVAARISLWLRQRACDT